MKHYQSKAELIATIQTALDKYLAEFADIPEAAKHTRMADGGKTPSEHLSYQLGWVTTLLDWEQREQAGEAVQTSAPGYKWNALGNLNQHYYHTYGALTLAEQQTVLREKVAALCAWIDSLSDNELFLPGQRQWATTAAQWPLWKWIHINTVAPFTNFRTQIRQWKKAIYPTQGDTT